MRCTLLSTYDIEGGAARAAYRLHKGLLGLGVQSAMLSREKKSTDPTVHKVKIPSDEEHGKIAALMGDAQRRLIDENRTAISNTFFSLPFPSYDVAVHPVVQNADILNLHWVANLLCPNGIARLIGTGKPVVWTLHDQRPFTGGCHYSAGCSRYEATCSDCPQMAERSSNFTERVLGESARRLPPGSLAVVAPSRWIAECARRSSLFNHARIEHIPYGLELDLYQPLPKAEAKQALGIPPESVCFLFGADSCGDQRKGFRELRAALALCLQKPAFEQRLAAGQLQFLCFGWGSEKEVMSGVPLKALGHLDTDAALCQAYSAAEVFLSSSLEDNLPGTVMEAMSCGTAVIAHAVGGIPELVIHQETGLLTPVHEPEEYAKALLWTLEHPEQMRAWQQNGRSRMKAEYSLEAQARRYLSLFEQLLAERSPVSTTHAGSSAGAMRCRSETLPLVEESLQFARQNFLQPRIAKIELLWGPEQGNDYRPSWKRTETFLNPAHQSIWEKTKDLPGWQDPEDSQKLYELGFYCGDVILEIGVFGGRSAVPELRGANAAARPWLPQYYGLDVDPGFIERSLPTLQGAGIATQCLLYHGNLRHFHGDLPVIPTMVFVDGDHEYEGVLADLMLLKDFLAPETPVLCHDYDTEGVKRAVDQMVKTPYFQLAGQFARGVLLRATAACQGVPKALALEDFARLRQQLLDRYAEAQPAPLSQCHHVPVGDLTSRYRSQLRPSPLQAAPAPKPWPHSLPTRTQLPASFPGGIPWPRITVVTPSFNHGQFLEETILSVLNQNYPNLEYIVMDGGSSDESVSILRRYESQLDFWASEKDRGQSQALNKGFALATGEILTWLNSDDMLAPGALAAVALGFHTSKADIVAGICQLHQDGVFLNQHLTSCPDGPLPLDQLLDQENCWDKGQFFYQPEVFFSRKLWERAGARLDESLYFSMDYELWLRFAQAGARIKVIGTPLALYRVHPAQKTFEAERYRPELREVRERFLAGKKAPPVSASPPRTKDKLRLVLLNDVGFTYGAGIAHERLARALIQAGQEVIPVALTSVPLASKEPAAGIGPELLNRIRSHSPDAVVLGNVHIAGLEPEVLKHLADEWPVVFVLHDTWFLTGRCAYPGTCAKYLVGCDETCPTAAEYPPLPPDRIAPAWQAKQDLITNCPGVVLAANSNWLGEMAKSVLSAIAKKGVHPKTVVRVIHYGLPLEIFRPRDRQFCRDLLGLPQDKFLLLFACTNVSDNRKGASHFVDAVKKLQLPDLVPVGLGVGAEELASQLPGIIGLGYTTNPMDQALLYSAVDLLVVPSLEEAFGQVFIEAAACGTPSIGYRVGGVPDALLDGVSGRVVSKVSADDLARAIAELYFDPQLRRDLGAWGELHVRSHFSFAASYHSLWFALRDALTARGVQLAPNQCFTHREPGPPLVEYVRPGADGPGAGQLDRAGWRTGAGAMPLEPQLEHYFDRRLKQYRSGPVPWVLQPGAWWARINRNAMRKAARKKQQGK